MISRIGRYEIRRRLGGGGFGEVYLGYDTQIDREVAIKVFCPKDETLVAFAASSSADGLIGLRGRFIEEARLLALLEHSPHIVDVHEFGVIEDGQFAGAPFYVMPYLNHSLAEELGRDVF